MECIFCKIVRGEIQALKIYEDEKVLAFLDINPCSKGHTLIIPKKHYESLAQVPFEEVGYLFAIANEIGKRAMQVLNAKGYNLGVNVGKVAGQEIMHVHLHAIPRYEGDKGVAVQAIVKQEVNYDLKEIAQLLMFTKKEDEEKNAKEKRCLSEKNETQKDKKEKKEHQIETEKSSEEEWAELVREFQDEKINLSEARNII